MRFLGAKYLIILFFVFQFVRVDAASVTIVPESDTVALGERFRITVSAEGSYKSLKEPEFKEFSVDNRSQSTSTSVSIINGKMERTKSISYTYVLSPLRAGVFAIGPAYLVLDGGKEVRSNTVNITVMEPPSIGSSGKRPERINGTDKKEEGAAPDAISAPLTQWEKRTPNYFIRSVIESGEEIYEGEPVIISYYIFAKPGAISQITGFEPPEFEKSWKEEVSPSSRLNFKRTVIGREPYDYSVLRTYSIIPERGSEVLAGTQMVVKVVAGSFFNVRGHKISSPAVNILLDPLPDAEKSREGIFGSFEVTVDKPEVVLDSDNILEPVTFSVKGCGNIHDVNIEPENVPGLQLFPPDIKTETDVRAGKYCGSKQFSFMLKGLRKGGYSLNAKDIYLFNREKGWHKVSVPSVNIKVNEVTAGSSISSGDRRIKYEVLRELPEGTAVYGIRLITEKQWFKIVLIIPFIIILTSLLLWLLKGTARKISMSFASKLRFWEEKCLTASDMNELLNVFYDALSALYSIELRGERKINIEKKYGQGLREVVVLIKDIQHITYSIQEDADLETYKKRAVKLLDPGVRGK